jgi:hypothetical protein
LSVSAIKLSKSKSPIPANSVLFFVSKHDMVEDAPVIQGIANLRNEFKANRRTLVSRAIKL